MSYFRFNLELAIRAWRRRYEIDHTFSANDVEELERHLRDHVSFLMERGWAEGEAFDEAVRKLGSYEASTRAYRKVLWAKAASEGTVADELRCRLAMIASYVHIALRRLKRDAEYAFVNLGSFILGLTCCLTLLLVVYHELSFDVRFEGSERIYRIAYQSTFGGDERLTARGPSALGAAIPAAFSQVESDVTLISHRDVLVSGPEGDLELGNLYYATPRFFNVFDFPLLHGTAETALSEPGAIVLTYDTAVRLFGRADVLGRRVPRTGGDSYTVTGVLKDALPPSHLAFEGLAYAPASILTVWNGFVALTYVKLRAGSDPDAFVRQVSAYVDRHAAGAWGDYLEPFLQPIRDIHLKSHLEGEVRANGDMRTLVVLALAAVLTLLMAATNYINLSTVRHARRGAEIGMRMALGAERRQIATQFLGESVILALVALPLALIAVALLRPVIESMLGMEMTFGAGTVVILIVSVLVLCVCVGLLAGIYPAFVIGGISPIHALRGEGREGRASVRLRRACVAFQFFVTILFVLTTTVIVLQIRYMAEKDLGYEPDGVYHAALRESVAFSRWKALQQAFLDVVGVESVSYGSLPGVDTGGFFSRDAAGNSFLVHRFLMGPRYAETLRMTLASGESVTAEMLDDASDYMMLNESAARLLQLDEPIGATLRADGIRTVIGVIEDFHFFSLREPIPPVFAYSPADPGPYLFIRVSEESGTLFNDLNGVWNHFFPEVPFTLEALSDRLQTSYERERKLAYVLVAFAAVAILVAYLGLFALVAYNLHRRRRELAIRRVLGAPALRLGWLLSAESVGLFICAAVLATATVKVIAPLWLNNFAYHTALSPLALGAVLAGILALTLIAVGFRVAGAIQSAPADALRQA